MVSLDASAQPFAEKYRWYVDHIDTVFFQAFITSLPLSVFGGFIKLNNEEGYSLNIQGSMGELKYVLI